LKLGMVVHTYNPSTQEIEAEEYWVGSQLGYVVRPCLKNTKDK
jgi:hypothetical protein